MQIYGPNGANRSQQVYLRKLVAKLKAAGITGPSTSDEVEISDVGHFLSFLSQLPDVRQDRVDALREQIENGTYDVDAKLDSIVDSLLADMGARGKD